MQTTLPEVITIDGPAGAGKSTLGELLARRLGYLYFDTGIMYRALTLAAIQQRIDPYDEPALAQLAEDLTIKIEPPTLNDGRLNTIWLDGHDVTWEVRQPAVEHQVSLVAVHPKVRSVLRRHQREIGQQGRVVMVGRDIGTVVMPDAPLKIYLKTSLDERARRRTEELRARGSTSELSHIQADVARRDELDQHVLHPADDAFVLECDDLTPEEELLVILEQLGLRQT
jgi:cytidylate kinase